jgi:hypothetical protein
MSDTTMAWDGPGWYTFEGDPPHGTRIFPGDVKRADDEGVSVGDLARRQGRGTPQWFDEPPPDVRIWPSE